MNVDVFRGAFASLLPHSCWLVWKGQAGLACAGRRLVPGLGVNLSLPLGHLEARDDDIADPRTKDS